MIYFPPYLARPAETIITPWSYQSIGGLINSMRLSSASDSNWIAANVVIYVPFWVPEPCIATQMFWLNGTAVAGNIDVGLYAEDQTRLVSIGSTAQTTTNRIQTVNITDTTLGRGRYYMAMVSDTSGATQKVRAGNNAAGIYQAIGLLEQASVTLPLSTNASPATFAKYTRAFLPQFGLVVQSALSLS